MPECRSQAVTAPPLIDLCFLKILRLNLYAIRHKEKVLWYIFRKGDGWFLRLTPLHGPKGRDKLPERREAGVLHNATAFRQSYRILGRRLIIDNSSGPFNLSAPGGFLHLNVCFPSSSFSSSF
jgi:hypothetical protein